MFEVNREALGSKTSRVGERLFFEEGLDLEWLLVSSAFIDDKSIVDWFFVLFTHGSFLWERKEESVVKFCLHFPHWKTSSSSTKRKNDHNKLCNDYK